MILPWFRRNSQAHSKRRTITDLYGAIVAQARSASFYADYGVPDTVEGRFDLLVLHLVLVLYRLGHQPGAVRGFGQELFDAFCRDLDANLREMGTGDLAVPKKMQAFAEAFYGRQTAYIAALESLEPRAFEKALARNIFPAGNDAGADQLAAYARVVLSRLDTLDDDAVMNGMVAFPRPEAFVHARA
jgi:cytochrome b pre-mRNA-processing protein 3